MIKELWQTIGYFFNLTFVPDVLWAVLPLFIATILILIYFRIYDYESSGWNTHLSNSFILLFTSMNLLRVIYGINNMGFQNYLDYSDKFIATIFLMLIGSVIVRLNFTHLLPEKYARYLSSPLTVNLIAYGIILLVYSDKNLGILTFFSLLILLIFFGIFFELMILPIKKIKEYLEKEKKKERLKDAKEAVFQIEELKNQLKEREKELKKIKLKEAEDKKKEGIILKKIYRRIK